MGRTKCPYGPHVSHLFETIGLKQERFKRYERWTNRML